MSSASEIRVQIVIPTYNDVDCIDCTINSIMNQQYDLNKIYVVIVDFGSTDGTYEKILSFSNFNIGVYQVDVDFTERRMISEALKIANYTYPGGKYCYRFVLKPGDIIYEKYISKMVGKAYEYRGYNLSAIICDTDIINEKGEKYSLPSMDTVESIIDGKTQYMKYIKNDYRYNVMCFDSDLLIGNQSVYGLRNECKWLAKCLKANYNRNALYIPEKLACIKEIYYADELEEIVLRWNDWIDFERTREVAFGVKMSHEERTIGQKNLAFYTLWRSFLLYKRRDYKVAKECFLFSTVVLPKIRETEIYKMLFELFIYGNENNINQVEEYFDEPKRV